MTISADRPKEKLEDDLLGHPRFAKILSDCILQYEHEDCLVLGLHGDWGSGKSTILNYVEHYLGTKEGAEKPIIVKFNPWWFSGKDHMARAFMNQFGSTLSGKYEDSELLLRILPRLLDFSAGVGDSFGVGEVMRGTAKLMEGKSKDINAIKNKIKEILQTKKTRIVVMIDDMDRLAPDEICQLLTVIKALVDFPNTIYLLAFDPKVTTQAIEKHIGLPGDRYLEKIIQVPFHVPEVNHSDLSSMFLGYIQKYKDDLESHSDRNWKTIYKEGIAPLMRVPRDAIRLANAVKVGYPPLREEVSFIDFIAVQALRLFFPDLYRFIYSNRVAFLKGIALDPRGIDPKNHIPKVSNHNGEQISDNRLNIVNHLLRLLFPRKEPGDIEQFAESHKKWKQEGRVCSKALFDLYFTLDIPPGYIGRAHVDQLLASADSSKQFATVLMGGESGEKAGDMEWVRSLLLELEDRIPDNIEEKKIGNIVTVLFDIGDQLMDNPRVGGWGDENANRISVIASKLLRVDRFQLEQIHDILKSAILGGEAIFTQHRYLADLERSYKNDGMKDDNPLKIALESLISTWLNRVLELVGNSIIFQHPELRFILAGCWNFMNQVQQDQLCQLIGKEIEDDSGFLQFISRFLEHGRHSKSDEGEGYYEEQHVVFFRPSGIERYIDINACASRLKNLREEGDVPSEFEETVSKFFDWYNQPNRNS